MSKYTTEIRYICETAAGLTESAGYSQVNQILQTAAPNIFNFNFPIFDETYRLPLEIKILRHYYTKEICEETVGLWKLRLEDRMNMIMPYYNQLYQSALLEFNPLYDVDITRDHTTDFTGAEDTSDVASDTTTIADTAETYNTETATIGTSETNTAETDITGSSNLSITETTNESVVREKDIAETDTDNSTKTTDSDTTNSSTKTTSDDTDTTTTETGSNTENSTQWDLYSDTPQGGVVGIANASDDVANNAYLTNARKITNNKSAQSSLTATGTAERDISETIAGSESLDQTDTFAGTKGIDIDENENTTTTGRNTRLETGSKTESTDTTENKTIDTNTSNTSTTTQTNTGEHTTEQTRTGNKNVANLEEYVEHVKGKQGGNSFSAMLKEFRETFLNIDKLLIDELSDLFFGLWA